MKLSGVLSRPTFVASTVNLKSIFFGHLRPKDGLHSVSTRPVPDYMWLLNTKTTSLLWVEDPRDVPYAILSHVWTRPGKGPPEQTFEELKIIHKSYSSRNQGWVSWFRRQSSAIPPEVSEKIKHCCAVAQAHGYDLIWIDTCCIDKGSSSELSEAINSMYSWYHHAKVCYAYLVDVDDSDDPRATDSQFRRSGWFSRGWTLQELISPQMLIFLSRGWSILGTKAMLADVIEEITGIGIAILTHQTSLDTVSIATRISWASGRQTTRDEDEAYSLMGILGINLPIIYGEGRLAFVRLQEEVLKQSPDQTLLAWGTMLAEDHVSDIGSFWKKEPGEESNESYRRNLFASSPRDFLSCGPLIPVPRHSFLDAIQCPCPPPEYIVTGHGIRLTLPILTIGSQRTGDLLRLAILACQDRADRLLALILRNKLSSSEEFFVGAFISPTMTMEDDELAEVDVEKTRTVRFGGLYFRTTHLSLPFIAAHRQNICLQQLYIPPRPPRGHIEVFEGYAEAYRKLTQCPGSFEVCLAGWCESVLEGSGYTIYPLRTEEEEDVRLSPKRGYVISKEGRTLSIQLDACSCSGILTKRWLRVVVDAHSVDVDLTYALERTGLFREPDDRHEWEHPDHVRSWSFAAGVASKQTRVSFHDGVELIVQLTLAPIKTGSQDFQQTYALGVEIHPASSATTSDVFSQDQQWNSSKFLY